MSNWYTDIANESDIVVSTRVRLARNLKDIPFPSRMSTQMREELKVKVKNAVTNSEFSFSQKLKYIDMKDVPELETKAMVERHIISPEFASKTEGRAIVISEDENISIMVGEEDHIRIQVILPGLQLQKAYETADKLDDFLNKSLDFAYDKQLGFLTECPTNLGTGLRASVMMHLPLCESTGQLSVFSESVAKIGFTIRGLYGEGSKASASLYQISNQITLGISEENAIKNLQAITSQIIEKESSASENLNSVAIEDKIYRALGTLQNCRILESKEMTNLISLIKLGVRMGILNKEYNPIKILVEGQPNMLMKKYGILNSDERDIIRAKHIREYFNSIK